VQGWLRDGSGRNQYGLAWLFANRLQLRGDRRTGLAEAT
jgi:hypothetical protein